MIKKLIGILFSAFVVATIVFTILGHGRYRSIIGQTELVLPSFFRSAPADASADPGRTGSRDAQPAPVAASAAADEDAMPDYMEDAEEELPSDLFSGDDY